MLIDEHAQALAHCIRTRLSHSVCDEFVNEGSKILVNPCNELCHAESIPNWDASVQRSSSRTRLAQSRLVCFGPLPNNGVIKNAKRYVIWNLPDFDFLADDAVAPETVNPSLWRDAQIMYRNAGLFKVTDGIYQVCGMDISNITFIEGDTGVTVMDVLLSEKVAKAALSSLV